MTIIFNFKRQSNCLNKSILFLIVALTIAAHVKSQSPQIFLLSGGTTANGVPFGSPSTEKYQCLYSPSNFPAVQGTINRLYWKSATSAGSTTTYSNFIIKLGQTASANFPGVNNTDFFTGLTTVYSSSSYVLTMVPYGEWFYIDLQTPFSYTYSATMSLVIEIQYSSRTGGAQSTSGTTVSGSSKRLLATSVSATSGTLSTNETLLGFDFQCSGSPLSGSYTINETAAFSSTNFKSLSGFVQVLKCNGINGPVVVNVTTPSAGFNEEIKLGAIAGSSSINTITINGNGKILSNVSGTIKPTINLNGADYTIWNNMTFNSSMNNGFSLLAMNQSDNNTFNNCTFNTSDTTTDPNCACIVFSNNESTTNFGGANGSNNTFNGCTLTGGYYNVVSVGTPSNLLSNNQFLNCSFRECYYNSFGEIYTTGTIIRGCTIERLTRTIISSSYNYGIYITFSSNLLIEKNRIRNFFTGSTSDTSYFRAIYLSSNGAAGSECKLINNIISDINHEGLTYGISLTGSYIQAYHNTIAIGNASSATTRETIGIDLSGNNSTVKNNIVSITRGGGGSKIGISVLPSSTSISINNNDYYINGAAGNNFIGRYSSTYATLANWQTANGGLWDLQSLNADPFYTNPSAGNYIPTNNAVNNSGVNVGVTTDIAGNARSVSTPDPGAYEFTASPVTNDLGVTALVLPAAGNCFGGAESVTATIKNFGSTTINFSNNPATITCKVTGTTTATLTYTPTGTLTSGATANITFSSQLNMGTFGTYNLRVYSSISGDSNLNNDSLPSVARTNVLQLTGGITTPVTSYCGSASPVLTLNGFAPGATIQWQSSTVSSTGPWTNVGTGQSTYTPTVTQTTYFRTWVGCTMNYIYSGVVTISINSSISAGVILASGNSFCGSASPLITLSNYTQGTTLQWQLSTTSNTGPWTNVGTGQPTYTPLVTQTTYFRVGVTCTGTTVYTTVIGVFINTFVGGSITTPTTSYCGTATPTLTLNPFSSGLTIQWQQSTVSSSGPWTNVGTGQLTYAPTVTQTTYFRVELGCSGNIAYSNVLSISVGVTGAYITSPVYSFCNSGSPVLTLNNYPSGVTMQWQQSTVSSSGPWTNVGAGSYTYTPSPALTQTTYFRVELNCGGNLSFSSFATINIASLPTPVISFYNNASSSCYSVYMQVNGGYINGTTYQWQLNSSNIAGATNNYHYAVTSGNYRCVVTNICGSATSNTLLPSITGTGNITYTGNTSFCSGSLVLNAPYFNDAIYQWYNNGYAIDGANSITYTATGSGVYTCDVITKGCGQYLSSNNITITGKPAIVAASPLSFCAGGSTVLHAYGGVSPTSFQWKLNGSAISGATLDTYTASASGSYVCDVSNPACGTLSSNVLTVTAGSTPQISVLYTNQFPNGYLNSCDYSTSIYVFPANAGTYSIIDAITNIPYYSQSQNSFGAPLTGYYYLQLDNGCGTTQSPVISVLNTNAGHEIVSDGATSLCITDPSPMLRVVPTHYASLSYVYGPLWNAYQWKLNGVNIPAPQGTAHELMPMQTGWYSCRVTNSCDTANYVDSLYITISTPPTVNVTANGPLTFCQGNSVTFNVNSTPGAYYYWTRNGSGISGATGTSYTATLAGTYKVGVQNGACPVVYSADQVVTLTYITANASSGNPVLLCSGQEAILEATLGTGLSYQWNLGTSPISGATSSIYTASAPGNYNVKITDSQGCYNTSSNLAVAIGYPAINISGGPTPACTGSTFYLNANASGGAISAYQWKLNGGVINGATNSSYIITASASTAGSYTVDVTNQCGMTTSSPYVLNVNPVPVTPVISTAGNNYFCTTGSVNLTSTTEPGVTYQWYNTSAISGATTSSYNATAAGTYYVKVTKGGTCTANSNNINVYSSGFVPTISPNNVAAACSSQVYTASPASGVTYQWKSGTSNISGATNSTYTATTSGAYSCTMSNGSCSAVNISPTTSYLIIWTYIFPVTASSSTTTSCGGQSINLFANGYSYFSYQWKLNGNNITGATSNTYMATASGTYTCFVTEPCGTTTSNSLVLTFNPVPSASITAGGSTNLCNGTSVTLNANTGTGLSYQWTTNGSNISGATSSSYTTSMGGTYRCIVTNSSGCSVTSNYINVFTTPAVISPSGSVTLCSGNVLQANTGTGLTYQWQKNGVTVSGATASSYTVTSAGNYNVVVTKNSCSATSATTVVNLTGAVPATPGSISATGGNTKVCPGDNKTYSIATVTGATSYTWTPPIGATITAGQGTKIVTVNYTATFTASDTIRVVAVNACGSSAQRTLKITRNTPSTPAAITGSAYGLCNLSNVPYSITSVAGMTYSWSFNVGTASVTGGQGTNSITANFNSGYATGTLSVNANNACGTSANRTLSIKAIPATPASITGATSVCANQQAVPYSISPIASAINYTWSGPTGSHVSDGTTTSSGTNLITTATNVTVNYGSTAGKINVRANNACGSGSYKNITVTFTCREAETYLAEENRNSENVKIYPNPTSDEFTLEYSDSNMGNASISIFDATGRIVFKRENISFNDHLKFGKEFLPGVYSVKVLQNNNMNTLKIIKTN